MFLFGNQRENILLNLQSCILFSCIVLNLDTNWEKNKKPLVAEQNNTGKILNAYIVYDLDTWRNNLYRKFLWKNCLVGLTILTKE